MNERAVDLVRNVAHLLSVESNLQSKDIFDLVSQLEEAQTLLIQDGFRRNQMEREYQTRKMIELTNPF